MPDWLTIARGDAPLIVSMPHTGMEIPSEIEAGLVSPWLARKDADWHVDKLYDFAPALGITTIRTAISRTVIDVNRDPSGKSLYPGQATTELCPTTSFDGESLYKGNAPSEAEIARLKAKHARVALFDAHSIRSHIPRLFDGELPNLNIGTNDGSTCDARLTDAVEQACAAREFSHVVNGRFKGGWTTRHYGRPRDGVHAIQLELACRGYMDEPKEPSLQNWPAPYSDARAAKMRAVLNRVLQACLQFASDP